MVTKCNDSQYINASLPYGLTTFHVVRQFVHRTQGDLQQLLRTAAMDS